MTISRPSRRGPAGSWLAGALLLGLLAFVPTGVEAQDAEPDEPPSIDPDTIQLVFERERFSYPTFQRRNPFRPLTGDATGPRFEELTFRGAILSEREGGSIALLSAPGGGPAGRNFRVRVGDVIGNVRILAIERRQVRVQVDEFGQIEQRVLELRRTEPQAEPGSDIDDQTGVDPDTTGTTGNDGGDPDTSGDSGSNGSGGSS